MSQDTFKAKRKTLSASMQLTGKISTIFPLMCPIREREWLEPWSCEMIYSQTGLAELDCVFSTTDAIDGEKDIWYISNCQPNKHLAFIRVNAWRCIHYTLDFKTEHKLTAVIWRQTITALNSCGNEKLDDFSQNEFQIQIDTINNALQHYIKTGTCLSIHHK